MKSTLTTVFKPILTLNRKKLAILAVIIFIGAILRFVGADWGLPYKLHADEHAITDDAFRIAANQGHQPLTLNRPDHTSIKLIAFVWQIVDFLVGGDIAEDYDANPIRYYTTARLVTASFGTASILLAFMIAAQFSPVAGLVAAGLFALSPTFVTHSHYITPEILQTFCLLCVTFFMMLYLDNQKLSTLALACVFCALAFCEKYPSIFYVLVIAGGIALAENIAKHPALTIKRWFQAGLIFTLTVFAVFPRLFFDWNEVVKVLQRENRTTHLGADGLNSPENLLFYVQTYLSHFGWIVLLASLFGFWQCARLSKTKSMVMFIGLFYIVMLSFMNLHWERWGVPFYANMLIIAAVGLVGLYEIAKQKSAGFSKISRLAVSAATIALLFGLPSLNMLCASFEKTASFVAEDTRVAALTLVSEYGMTRENTLYEGYTPFRLASPRVIFDDFTDYDFSSPNDTNYEYIILSSSMYNRYLIP
ncbi:MAG: glycosyltransferase family 39 protein [Lachnospiraceae bacterium]|jgi:hypothetical protein|nr:glycosyltransferase family 39 protein [Lachnospiraceae bacterium]